jgi:hypothetical protein
LKETKEHIEGWMDDARERRPALLILDGLDNLLGPEHEVSSAALVDSEVVKLTIS